MNRDTLRRLPLFEGLADDDLARLDDMVHERPIEPGELLMAQGDPGDAVYVVLDGEFEITKRSNDQEFVLAVRGAGEVLGEMALLENAPRNATVRATQPGRVLVISKVAFNTLLACSPGAPLAMLRSVTAKLRSTEAVLQQHQKLAALGTLSAGVAHELNNPAAAMARSAPQLRETLADWQRLTVEVGALNLSREQKAALDRLREEMARQATETRELDPLEVCDLEDSLQTWLEDQGVDEAWELAPQLVDAGVDSAAIQKLGEGFSAEELAVVLPWAATGAAVYDLVDELGMSAERISEIVKAVKTYSYLDQAPVQEVDIHDGLENTLVILRHKLKQGITVRREYDRTLPRLEAYGSELNQVWTNIIDNAIDAMKGAGELTIRTRPDGQQIVVDICDNGPGIPPGIQARIFEPFFTTKGPGSGSGLGLHISYNTIAHRHRGRITVDSEPGKTCFHVALPLQVGAKNHAARSAEAAQP